MCVFLTRTTAGSKVRPYPINSFVYWYYNGTIRRTVLQKSNTSTRERRQRRNDNVIIILSLFIILSSARCDNVRYLEYGARALGYFGQSAWLID